MALPNTNLSVSMVKSALGAATNDVGGLCIHPNINKWSKWKPVRHTSVSTLTEAQLASVNFGLTVEEVSPHQLPQTKALEQGLFISGTYLRPTGGSSSPYRLGDFRNYEQQAIPPVNEIILQNWLGGDKPIAGNSTHPNVRPNYYCRLKFNLNANIKLFEMKTTSLDLSNLYLTLVIGANIGGLSISEHMIQQSTNSVEEAITLGSSSEMFVEMDTTDLVDTLNGMSANIVFVYLAPRITGNISQFPIGASLKLYDGLQSAKYNSNYAIYGDGGDGGTPSTITAIGTWNWRSIPKIFSNGNIIFDFLDVNVSTSAPGVGDLRMWIDEFDTEYTITQEGSIDFSSSGQQTIDTSISTFNLGDLVNPITGIPYTQLTCRFYIRSTTPSVTANFNDEIDTIIIQ